MDMAVLPGVLGCRPLRRTIQVCLGANTLRLPGGTTIFTVSRQQFIETSGLIFLFTTLSTSSVPLVLFAHGAGLAERLARAEQPFW